MKLAKKIIILSSIIALSLAGLIAIGFIFNIVKTTNFLGKFCFTLVTISVSGFVALNALLLLENHRLKAHMVPRIPVVGNEHRTKDLRVVAARHRSAIVSRRAGPQHHVFTPLQYPLYANDFPADTAALKRNARNEHLVGVSLVCSRIKCGSVEAHGIIPRPFFP